MRRNLVVVPIMVLLLTAFAAAVQQQDKSKRPSPPGTAETTLNGKKVTIEYSRPSMKGRKIMGELVPYGKVWRTGANEATTLTTEGDLNIGGTSVPTGKYTLFTLPSENGWKLIINKQIGQWGTVYDESKDLARIDMQKAQTKAPVEQFTISFHERANTNEADLVLEWENIRLNVLVKGQ
jgi:Protein of unknown function (DUF2911)